MHVATGVIDGIVSTIYESGGTISNGLGNWDLRKIHRCLVIAYVPLVEQSEAIPTGSIGGTW